MTEKSVIFLFLLRLTFSSYCINNTYISLIQCNQNISTSVVVVYLEKRSFSGCRSPESLYQSEGTSIKTILDRTFSHC